MFLVSKGTLTRPIGSMTHLSVVRNLFPRPTFFSSFITPLIYTKKIKKSEIRGKIENSKIWQRQ